MEGPSKSDHDGACDALEAQITELGLDIAAAASRSRWLGEPSDYDLAIGAM